jgi:hypothetical protein
MTFTVQKSWVYMHFEPKPAANTRTLWEIAHNQNLFESNGEPVNDLQFTVVMNTFTIVGLYNRLKPTQAKSELFIEHSASGEQKRDVITRFLVRAGNNNSRELTAKLGQLLSQMIVHAEDYLQSATVCIPRSVTDNKHILLCDKNKNSLAVGAQAAAVAHLSQVTLQERTGTKIS